MGFSDAFITVSKYISALIKSMPNGKTDTTKMDKGTC